MEYNEVLSRIKELTNDSTLVNCCNLILEQIHGANEIYINQIESNNISFFKEAIFIDWINSNYYVQLKIKTDEASCEVKLPDERNEKSHPVHLKIIPILTQSLETLYG